MSVGEAIKRMLYVLPTYILCPEDGLETKRLKRVKT